MHRSKVKVKGENSNQHRPLILLRLTADAVLDLRFLQLWAGREFAPSVMNDRLRLLPNPPLPSRFLDGDINLYTPCSKKTGTPAHIDNLVNSKRIFKILSLAHSAENLL